MKLPDLSLAEEFAQEVENDPDCQYELKPLTKEEQEEIYFLNHSVMVDENFKEFIIKATNLYAVAYQMGKVKGPFSRYSI